MPGTPAIVEIINFAAISASTTFRVKIAKVKNPAAVRGTVKFTLKMIHQVVNTNVLTPIGNWQLVHEDVYSCFLNLVSNAVAGDYTVGDNPTFTDTTPTRKYVTTANGMMLHDVKYTTAFAINDVYVTEIPSTPSSDWWTLPQSALAGATCVAANYNYCHTYVDIGWVEYSLKTAIGAATGQTVGIDVPTMPRGA